MSKKNSERECKVTIIIPVYKVEKYVRESVKSVLEQSYKNIQIILVDDGSPDACPAICDELAMEYANVMVRHKRNGGLSSARNAGLDAIESAETDLPEEKRTKYVIFLDSDDKLEKDAVAGMLRRAEDTGAEMVIPDRYTRVEEATGEAAVSLHFPEAMYETNPKAFAVNILMREGRAWRSTALLYSYEVIRKNRIRFPIGHISEDISFNLKVLANINNIAIYPYSTLLCLKRAASITTSFQSNFEKDIWYIDEQARKFLEDIGEKGASQADDLLCRNIVVYIASIMSKRNRTMNYKDKQSKSVALLNDPKSRGVVRTKRHVPYFESRKKGLSIRIVYYLLRHGQDRLVCRLLSKI